MDNILEPILTALTLGIVGVILAIIKSVGNIAIEYIAKKKEVVEQKLQLDKHEEEIKIAKQIWNIVEEKYRITDNITNLANSKANEFDKLLLKKIPYLSKNEIEDIRQALAGEINKGKTLLNEDNLKKQAKDLANKNSELERENTELKNKLNNISSIAPIKEQE
ncbi:coiled-coil domain-containing protein [Clostridium perfringens]|uniref:cobalt ABC transporter permease n=2 Tax=Clostridium perfringens TaxID=1502 RepID=UPI001DD93440|nr:cobalt ABC transporter permease [Clostridium perfringens]EHA6441859.1 cobalt ABC transporter permease [Clostridium perfringens]MDU1018230.1 cobalt ABC transporter permease [Clostridium perfringens]MEA5268943.1 cobalt ABC transporter permease [Clostridium perfringens]MEA5380633.1 cobalt ABC transporter permease [Clostridium perfringens]